MVQLTSFKYYSLFQTRFNTKIAKTPSAEIGRTLPIFVNVVANFNSQNDEVRKVWIQIVTLFFQRRDIAEQIAMKVTDPNLLCARGVVIGVQRTSQTTTMEVTRNVTVAAKLVIMYGYVRTRKKQALTGSRNKNIRVFIFTNAYLKTPSKIDFATFGVKCVSENSESISKFVLLI